MRYFNHHGMTQWLEMNFRPIFHTAHSEFGLWRWWIARWWPMGGWNVFLSLPGPREGWATVAKPISLSHFKKYKYMRCFIKYWWQIDLLQCNCGSKLFHIYIKSCFRILIMWFSLVDYISPPHTNQKFESLILFFQRPNFWVFELWT